MEENYPQKLKEIANQLKKYGKRMVSVRQYCEMSTKILGKDNQQGIYDQDLFRAYNLDLKDSAPVHKENNSLKISQFLIKPNVQFNVLLKPQKFTLPSQVVDLNKQDVHYVIVQTKKQQQQLLQTGARIISMISYAWDYLFRLIKGKWQKHKDTTLFNDENIQTARKQLKDMVRELQGYKYHWELLDKREAMREEIDRKDVQDQYNFVKLLDNMLKAQNLKLKANREKVNKKVQQKNKAQSQESKALHQANEKAVEVKKKSPVKKSQAQKMNIQDQIDIRGYFQRKRKRLAEQKPASDPISQLEQRRKFNAAVLRYAMGLAQTSS